MHINYSAQSEYKRQLVKDALLRIGGIDINVDFVGAENPLRYRNKMVFPFSKDGEWGFYKNRSHDVVTLKDSGAQAVQNALNTLRNRREVYAYNRYRRIRL